MSANIVTTLPLGPLDPERTELLLRVVDGLEPVHAAVAVRLCRRRRARARRWPARGVSLPAVRSWRPLPGPNPPRG